MLLDLGRNDVGRVAAAGTVQVTDSYAVERYSHVMHIVSNVVGRLAEGKDALDALFAGFRRARSAARPRSAPARSSPSWSPKHAAPMPAASAISRPMAIWTAASCCAPPCVKDGVMHVQAGAGIVADSDPEYEQRECEAKAGALMAAAREAVRYDERREIVVSEANAIGTAWLRAGLIEGAGGAALQNSLTHYAELRSRLPHEGETEAVERETAEAQRQLWAQMRQSLGATPPPISATLINAMNEMFDIAAARKAEREAHIPGAVVEILLLYALLSAGIVGYVLGASEARHRGITFVLFVLLTLSLVLILDLDRPWRGGVTVSQQPMADLVAGLKTRS
jgi:hypothetical protein